MSYTSLSQFLPLFESRASERKQALMESVLTESIADATKVNTIALVTKTALNTKRVTPGNINLFLQRRLADAGLKLTDNVAGTTNTVADYIHANGVAQSNLSQSEKDSIKATYAPNLAINDIHAQELPETAVNAPAYTSATNSLQAKADAASAEGAKIAQAAIGSIDANATAVMPNTNVNASAQAPTTSAYQSLSQKANAALNAGQVIASNATGRVPVTALQQKIAPKAPVQQNPSNIALPNVNIRGAAPTKYTSAFQSLADRANKMGDAAVAGLNADLDKTGVNKNAQAAAQAAGIKPQGTAFNAAPMKGN